MKNRGKVWLVGAGPGDAGLLTIKAARLLEAADAVVYDSLVGTAVLAMIPDTAIKIDVGKRAGQHTMPQEKINQALVDLALAGLKVVRLKGGDPFLFGRGGEELETLKANDVPYELVPGITSSIAVPAYSGIPVTHRDYVSSVHIITGHRKKDDQDDTDYEALVKTGGTLVFLMGLSALDHICTSLMNAGMAMDMPAAVLAQGTTADQKTVTATVKTLSEEAKKADIKAPAIIVVGEVCRLSRRLSFREQLPLFGKRILITRPKQMSGSMAKRLEDLGAEVLCLPTIETKYIENNNELCHALHHLRAYNWLVFTSPTGVRMFFKAMSDHKIDQRLLGQVRFAVIGAATKQALIEEGYYADLMPKIYTGEELGKTLADQINVGDRVLIPRAKEGNQELVALITAAGAVVSDIGTYETLPLKQSVIDLGTLIQEDKISCVVFTSSSTVKGFMSSIGENGETESIRKTEAVCIGEKTAKQAEAYGMKTMIANEATTEAVIEKIMEMYGSNRS